jgi:hypothetical protein
VGADWERKGVTENGLSIVLGITSGAHNTSQVGRFRSFQKLAPGLFVRTWSKFSVLKLPSHRDGDVNHRLP